MSRKVRLRFAPSPTGGLHLGGVRTVLYNYLFARHHGGDFILRIEDTDQGRYVPGAEEYIIDSLRWCGLDPDEGPHKPGAYGPYRQSERKALGHYEKYARQLVADGHAYYAFDTPEELEEMRTKHRSADNPSPQYNHELRRRMKNSLTLLPGEVDTLLAAGTPFVIRIKMIPDEEVRFTDMIRGEVSFSTSGVDDKVLLKADGMPTYHLAVVVDDHLMEITHAFRGEEWLPSAPVHILLWKYLFGLENMPQWAHLPLILKPDGNGKLSKRDGDRLGFPVFAMNWTDPKTQEPATGFKETGFLPEALVNFLAMLGWNDGTGKEIFSIEELVSVFSMDRVHKGGAKFDYEKAKWFNHEWIKRQPVSTYSAQVLGFFRQNSIDIPNSDFIPIASAPTDPPDSLLDLPAMASMAENPGVALLTPDLGFNPEPAPANRFEKILHLVKDRCTLLTDFVQQSSFFFKAPETIDTAAIKPKWNDAKVAFFAELILAYELLPSWEAPMLEAQLKEMAAAASIKPGDLLLPLRVMLVGGKFGPGVFDIAFLLGKEETFRRIRHGLAQLKT